ncbi:MAG: DMT family transporter [Deltaproteobacteria bacterium]
MPLWIPLTLGAAFFQNLRSALQRHLVGDLSTAAASAVRFIFGLPFALVYLCILIVVLGEPLPRPEAVFFGYAVAGGLAQILGTVLLVTSVSRGNFVVGTTYSKTEPMQTALFGLVLVGDSLSAQAVVAILASAVGVAIVSTARSGGLRSIVSAGVFNTTALAGLAAGSGFGVAAVCYRGASLSLTSDSSFVAAATTLVWVLAIQSLLVSAWLVVREPGQFRAIGRHFASSTATGFAGMVASVGWFTAMTLERAAYVRALGQMELLFALAASYLFFGERTRPAELLGVALVMGALVALVTAN